MSGPIVILGAPRSGTTLLAELLSAHPGVARTREARLVWRFGNDGRSDELRPEHARPAVIEHIQATLVDLQQGPGRLVEKTPANAVRPWFVDAVLPDAVYVHIVRNGWAGVPAIRRFWEQRGHGLDRKQVDKARRRLREADVRQLPHYAGELVQRVWPGRRSTPGLYGPRVAGLGEVVREAGVLGGAALQWQRCVERSAAFGREIGPTRYLEVQLEALDGDMLQRIAVHCGLPPDDALLAAHEEAYDTEAARRRLPLTEDERRLVGPVVMPLNPVVGYPAELPVGP